MQLEKSILIEAPPAQIWPYLVEPEKIKAWYFPLVEFEYTGEQQGGEGATIHYVEKSPLGRVKMNFKVTEWEENQRFAFNMTEGGFLQRYNQRFTIEPTSSGSNFIFYEEAEFPWGFIGRLVERLAARGSQANIKKMLAKLKELVEAGE